MKKAFWTGFIFLGLFFGFLNPALAQEKYVTVVNPVRSRVFWQEISILDDHIKAITQNQLKATWLLQYDVLSDDVVVDRLKSLGQEDHELGIFLEVSESLATDARVAYLRGEGDYFRPDKVFLSSYSLTERIRLIKAVFEKFKQVFGDYPQSVGAWYLDPFSLSFLAENYGVAAAVICADQWQTDKYQLWGQPWGVPFYPSKYNSLVPAANNKEKLDVVLVQWAMRDPLLGYGSEVRDSTYSLQANDYAGFHGLDIDYFKELLKSYLETDNAVNQATVGLEVAEARGEREVFQEFEKQLQTVKKLEITTLTLGQFAQYYQKNFDLMPLSVIRKNGATWLNHINYRAGFVEQEGEIILRDLRFYQPIALSPDLLKADKREKLYRQLSAEIDQLALDNARLVSEVKAPEVKKLGLSLKAKLGRFLIDIRQALAKTETQSFGGLRFSQIDGRYVIGLWLRTNKLLGFKTKPFQLGFFTYPFQTLARFKGLR